MCEWIWAHRSTTQTVISTRELETIPHVLLADSCLSVWERESTSRWPRLAPLITLCFHLFHFLLQQNKHRPKNL